jgi:aminopyrrolnitrin oxygenase
MQHLNQIPKSWYIACPANHLPRHPIKFELFSKNIIGFRAKDNKVVFIDEEYLDIAKAKPLEYKHMLNSKVYLQLAKIFKKIISKKTLVYLDEICLSCDKKYVVQEKHGYIWIWNGYCSPLFSVPIYPTKAISNYYSTCYSFYDITKTSVRRITENSFDYAHLTWLHGLESKDEIQVEIKDYSKKNFGESVVKYDYSFGAKLKWTKYTGALGIITNILCLNSEHFELDINNWPSGQVVTFLENGLTKYELLLSTSPVNQHVTIQHVKIMFSKTGSPLFRDLYYSILSSIQIKLTSDQDIPIFKDVLEAPNPVYVSYDDVVIKYRKYFEKMCEN